MWQHSTELAEKRFETALTQGPAVLDFVGVAATVALRAYGLHDFLLI